MHSCDFLYNNQPNMFIEILQYFGTIFSCRKHEIFNGTFMLHVFEPTFSYTRRVVHLVGLGVRHPKLGIMSPCADALVANNKTDDNGDNWRRDVIIMIIIPCVCVSACVFVVIV